MNRVSKFFSIAIGCVLMLAIAASALAATANVDTRPLKFGTTLPVTCWTGDLFFNTSAAAGANLFACVALNTWVTQGISSIGGDVTGPSGSVTVGQIQGHPVASSMPLAGQSLMWNGTTARWEPQTGGSGSGPTTLSGDVVGLSSSVTVTQIQGHAVASIAPQNGQALVWNGSTTRWEPQVIAAGGGTGTAATMATQLGDFAVTQTNAVTLTIGANCAFTTPCNVRFGALAYSLTAPVTVSLAGGTGNALIYFASSGTLTVGHNLSLSCSGSCSAQASVTAFPIDAIPLFNWHATNGAWDPSGSDLRAFLSSKDVLPGTGLLATETSGHTIIAADPSIIGMRTTVPASSTAACTPGYWAADTAFYYVCVTQNTWFRASLTTW